MKYKSVIFFALFIAGVLFTIYYRWFTPGEIIGGDWPYSFAESLQTFALRPYIWLPWAGNGMGYIHPVLGLHAFHSFLVVFFTQFLHLSWEFVYKVFWFGLFLFLSVFSIWKLFKQLSMPNTIVGTAVGSFIYATNTYALMIASGGQMGVVLAYAVAPFVLSQFIAIITPNDNKKILNSQFSIRSSIYAGLVLGVQMLWDPRIAYMTLIAVALYFVFWRKNIFLVALAGIIALLLNIFWILPLVLLRNNPVENLGSAYTSVDALRFFSFADFSHALAMLHPNWPENLFGKTYFLQPEFLLIPLVAFGALLFAKSKLPILFFAFLALIGAFLAKGANPPFGELYVWLFEHVPGFVVFRDSTKFYMLIAMSYAVLIPFSIQHSAFSIQQKKKSYKWLNTKHLLLYAFVVFWLFTIREAAGGKLSGTFTHHAVPNEYIALKDTLVAEKKFGRTLWVPRQSRFTFFDAVHPSMEAVPLFGATDAAALRVVLATPGTQEKLSRLGVGHIIVPYDALGELFLNDRKYDELMRRAWEEVLDEVSWLTKESNGVITVYATSSHKDHFWLDSDVSVTYERIHPSLYRVVLGAHADDVMLYFSEQFHPGWVVMVGNVTIPSQKSDDNINSFVIPASATRSFSVQFMPQQYVDIGVGISFFTLVVAVVTCAVLVRRSQREYN